MKTKHFVATVWFFASAITVPLLFWISGFDFDHRGDTALGCALATLVTALFGTVMAATYPDDLTM